MPGADHEADHDQDAARIRLAVAQTTFRNDPGDRDAFRSAGAEVRQLMQQARAAGAGLVQFPEATLCFPDKLALSPDPGRLGEADWTRFAWDALEQEVQEIRAAARTTGLWTLLGAQRRPPSVQVTARPTSSLLVIDPAGAVVLGYDERLLSRSKQRYLYAPGTEAAVVEISGLRIGLTSGLEVLFPTLFSDYEARGVDAVLFSTAGPGDPVEADSLASSARTHAQQNGIWVGYAVPCDKAPYAAAGVIAPDGTWASRCPAEVRPGIAVADLTARREHPGREWRRSMLQSLTTGQPPAG